MRAVTTSSKVGLLGSLYFCQGLPYGFFTQALPVMLRTQGYSHGEIGLASLLALPWALKFVWAPAVDRYGSTRLGRRKSWIIPLQLASAGVLVALSGWRPGGRMAVLMAAVLLLNLLAATQDIATDGLAIDLLSAQERGLANGIQVAGYRMGMIVGGGLLLALGDRLGLDGTFRSMAALTALATLPLVLAREPAAAPAPRAVERPGAAPHFLRRPGSLRLLGLIVTYKAGESFATAMLRPFLADAGLSLADIGWLLGTVGFAAGLIGAVCGGVLVSRLGRRTALLSFGLLQAVTVAGYAYLALASPALPALHALCTAEHFAGGMATAALFTCMMDWSSRETGATDYTVQASAVVIATGLASTVAGFSAQALGYLGHFCLATVLALATLVTVRRCFPVDGAARGRGGPCLAPWGAAGGRPGDVLQP